MKREQYLNEKIVIPEVVKNKEAETFEFIKARSIKAQKPQNNDRKKSLTAGFSARKVMKKPILVAAVIALFVLISGTALAAFVTDFWSRGLDSAVKGTQAQRTAFEERGFVKNLDMDAITINGVTVKPVIAITDGTVGYISVEVSGYNPKKGSRPAFNSKGEFYVVEENGYDYADEMEIEGLHWFGGGNPMTGFFKDEESEAYTDENGNLEFIAEIIYTNGSLFGKTVHFEMDDLGVYIGDSNVLSNVVKGCFEFDVVFPKEESAAVIEKTFEISAEVASSDYIIRQVTVSPLAIVIDYDINEAGGCVCLDGIVMSDGEVTNLNYPYYKAITAPEITSQTITGLGRIIDVEKIESVIVHYFPSKPGEIVPDTIMLNGQSVEKHESSVNEMTVASDHEEITDIVNENFKGK